MSAWIRRSAPLAAALSIACAARTGRPPLERPGGKSVVTEGSKPTRAKAPEDPSPTATAEPTSEEDGADDEEAQDDVETEAPPDATIAVPHPLDGIPNEEIDRRVTQDPASLGPMSVGRPNAGRLINGVQMPEGDGWEIVAPGAAWATQETVDALKATITKVARAFQGTPRLPIGDISAQNGGYLSPHLSHQAGRDVDIGYYYSTGHRWYRRATAENLDLPRTWAFVRALVTDTDVEMLLIDRSIQGWIRDYAERAGESREWLDLLFRGKGATPPLIRHAPGHATHIHIRFYSPTAQETARRAYPALVRHHKVPVGASFVTHVARKGDTLAKLARRFHTTVRAIRQANGLKSSVIQAKKTYRIPSTTRAPPSLQLARVAIPPRRLPPGEPRMPPVSQLSPTLGPGATQAAPSLGLRDIP